MLKTVLSLYMKDPNLPLPSSAEVCICTSTTTAEEVTLYLCVASYLVNCCTSIHEVTTYDESFCYLCRFNYCGTEL